MARTMQTVHKSQAGNDEEARKLEEAKELAESSKATSSTASDGPSTSKTDAGPSSSTGAFVFNLPEDHLKHPETWTTGDDPATAKQTAFVESLEQQKGVDLGVDEAELGKSEASEVIDRLLKGDGEGAKEVIEVGGKRGIESVKKDEREPTEEEAEEGPSTKKVKTDDKLSIDKKDTKDDTSIDLGDGAKIDPKEETSTGAPAVIEENGESRKDHPENWQTGEDPATEKQLAYLAVLEKQKGAETSAEEKNGEMGKSEASEKIERLKEA